MRLTKITPITDTGLRALVKWNTDGIITYGKMPIGLAHIPGVAGGIYVRMSGRKVTLSILAAKVTTTNPIIPVPSALMPASLYPQIPVGVTGMIAKIGSANIYISGATPGMDLPDASGVYALALTWETDKLIPNPIPGIPA